MKPNERNTNPSTTRSPFGGWGAFILALLLSCTAPAQLKFNDTEFFTAALVVDPVASVKEQGLNIGAEIGLVSHWGYVRAGLQTFNKLEGGYIDLTGAGGISLRYGHFSPFRFYGGLRLGVIYREKYPYPTAGIEGGIDLYTQNNLVLGVRTTYDHRTDAKYWGGDHYNRLSGFVRIGLKF